MLAGIGLALFALVVGRYLILCLDDPTRDFRQDYLLVRAAAGGANPYQPLDRLARTYAPELALDSPGYRDDRPSPHPPAVILLLLPLALASYPVAGAVWLAVDWGLLGLAIWLTARVDNHRWTVPQMAVLWTLAPALGPVVADLAFGQLCLLLSTLILAAWLAIRGGHEHRGAALLAMAAAIKLSPLLLFAWFVVRRRWGALVVGCATFVALHVLALLVLGHEALLAYVSRSVPGNAIYLTDERNLSIVALTGRVFAGGGYSSALVPAPWIVPWARVVVVGLVLAMVWRTLRTGQDENGFAGLICGVVLLAPTVWNYWYVLLIWPAWLVYRRGRTSASLLVMLLGSLPHQLLEGGLPGLLLASPTLLVAGKLTAPLGILISGRVAVPLYLLARLSRGHCGGRIRG